MVSPLVLRRISRIAVAVSVIALIAALGAGFHAQAQTPPSPIPPTPAAEGPRTLRIGIVHPQPRLCTGQEPSQRDLRVLRLAFGLQRTLPGRLEWPWFLNPATPGDSDIVLRSDQLWEQPWPSMTGTLGHPGRMAAWQQSLVLAIPAFGIAPLASGAALRVRSADPLLASRLAGHEWLPDYAESTASGEPVCRHWPVGIDYRPQSGRETYILRRTKPGHGPLFTLIGYRSSAALWADYAGGRLDLAFIEGSDLGSDALISGQTWGMEVGTQQVVLRVHGSLGKTLPPDARAMLSEAINRVELAQMAPRGTYRPVRAFVEPLMPSRNIEETEVFQWDSNASRQSWLEKPHDLPRLRVAALNQALLEPMAQRLAGQWQKTLEIPAVAQGFGTDQLWREWERSGAEMMLDVVDLDDGSLQDLWSASLGSTLRSKDGPAAWEPELRTNLPYLPLLTNLLWVVSNAGAGPIQQVCPACVIGGSP